MGFRSCAHSKPPPPLDTPEASPWTAERNLPRKAENNHASRPGLVHSPELGSSLANAQVSPRGSSAPAGSAAHGPPQAHHRTWAPRTPVHIPGSLGLRPQTRERAWSWRERRESERARKYYGALTLSLFRMLGAWMQVGKLTRVARQANLTD